MKYAIVRIGGTQHKISAGEILEVDKLEGKKGQKLTLNEVLLLVDDQKVKIGQPILKTAKVEIEIVDQIKGEKIRAATFKAKARERKVKGFRPLLTRVKILSIMESSGKEI